MNKLVECPSCLGTGETVYKGKHFKRCVTCAGNGMVEINIAQKFLNDLTHYTKIDEIDPHTYDEDEFLID